MKHFRYIIPLFAMLALTGCKHTQVGSSTESATNKPDTASTQTADTQTVVQTDSEPLQAPTQGSVEEQREKVDLSKIFNPSYTMRPEKEAFYNQVELKLDGKVTHTAVAKAILKDADKLLCENNECGSTVHFEDETIPPVHIPYSLDLDVTNLGDLDDDGNDELGAIAEWGSGTYRDYHVLTLKKGEWYEMFMPPVDVDIEYLRDHPYIPVEKIPETPGILRAHVPDHDTGKLEVIEIPIPYVLLEMNDKPKSADTQAE